MSLDEKKSSLNADGIYAPFSVEDVAWDSYEYGQRFGSRYRQLAQFGGASHIVVFA